MEYKNRNVKIFLCDICPNFSRYRKLKAATKTDDKSDTLYRWNKTLGEQQEHISGLMRYLK